MVTEAKIILWQHRLSVSFLLLKYRQPDKLADGKATVASAKRGRAKHEFSWKGEDLQMERRKFHIYTFLGSPSIWEGKKINGWEKLPLEHVTARNTINSKLTFQGFCENVVSYRIDLVIRNQNIIFNMVLPQKTPLPTCSFTPFLKL